MQVAAKIVAKKPAVFDGKGKIDDWIESMKAGTLKRNLELAIGRKKFSLCRPAYAVLTKKTNGR